MLYDFIVENYEVAEPIFFSDIEIADISKSALSQQLKNLCEKGVINKYSDGVYYRPKETELKSSVGLNADIVARYRFISRGGKTDGFYTGNAFANQLGISTQVPQVVEIVSNNTNSSARIIKIGGREFYVRKPVVPVTASNVYILQLLELLKNLDAYNDGTYKEAGKKIAIFIDRHGITRRAIDQYIRKFPASVFRYYYELELDHVLA